MKPFIYLCVALFFVYFTRASSFRHLQNSYECQICLDQCNNITKVTTDFYSGAYSGWQALQLVSGEVDYQVSSANDAVNLTQVYNQYARKYKGLPHLDKVAQALQASMATVGDRYTVYRKKILTLQSEMKKSGVIDHLSEMTNQLGVVSNFTFSLWNSTEANEVQTVCGFDACKALTQTVKEISEVKVPNMTFTNATQFWSLYDQFRLFWRQLTTYRAYDGELIEPLQAILNKKYTACNATCLTESGFVIVTSGSPILQGMFPQVVQSVDDLVNNNIQWVSNYVNQVVNYWSADITLPDWNMPKEGVRWPSMKLSYANRMRDCVAQISK